MLKYALPLAMITVYALAFPPHADEPKRSAPPIGDREIDAAAHLPTSAKVLIRINEGERRIVYQDRTGVPTIGVGANLLRPDMTSRLRSVGASRARVLAGEQLTAYQIERLLEQDVAEAIADLRQLLPGFDTMPRDARLVLVDLRFNCGPGGVRTFVHTLAAFKRGEWRDAADRLALSQWAKQVGPRAGRSIKLLRGIS